MQWDATSYFHYFSFFLLIIFVDSQTLYMGWDGMRCDTMGCHGMRWDSMGCDGIRSDGMQLEATSYFHYFSFFFRFFFFVCLANFVHGMGWDGMGWDGMGWDGTGRDVMGWDG